MSRIGNKPVAVPTGVKVEISGLQVKVAGPKGILERTIRAEIGLAREGENLLVSPKDNSKKTIALQGLTRTLVDNMIIGVAAGFTKKLMIEGVGYKADVAGSSLTLNVGYSNPVKFDLPTEVKAVVGKDNSITLESIDKELLGLTAARIRAVRKPEPYKGKGIRYVDEHIVRKVGKSGASS